MPSLLSWKGNLVNVMKKLFLLIRPTYNGKFFTNVSGNQFCFVVSSPKLCPIQARIYWMTINSYIIDQEKCIWGMKVNLNQKKNIFETFRPLTEKYFIVSFLFTYDVISLFRLMSFSLYVKYKEKISTVNYFFKIIYDLRTV